MLNKISKPYKYNKFSSFLNQWLNSIYSFDKNKLNTIFTNKVTNNVIKNYFHKSRLKTSQKIFRHHVLRWKRTFVSVAEIRHSLTNINILIYVFNKKELIFNKRLRKLQKYLINNLHGLNTKKLFNNSNLSKLNLLELNPNKTNLTGINVVKLLEKFLRFNLYNRYSLNFTILFKWINLKKFLSLFKSYYYHNYIKLELAKGNKLKQLVIFLKRKPRPLRKIVKTNFYYIWLYKRYISKLDIQNHKKFNQNNLFYLTTILCNIYNKPVNINIVKLKRLYLDNHMFTYDIVRKLKKRRVNLLRVLRNAINLSIIPKIDFIFFNKQQTQEKKKNLYNICNFNQHLNVNNINKLCLKSIKNMHIVGIRLEGRGRLTKRLTAARAIYKKVYLGNLKNIYSSTKGLSSPLFKGYSKSNINYVNLNSYTRNGAYGIKSWHNTM